MNHLAEFQEHLVKSRRVVALVGAGILVALGLPTFRGSDGLWKNYNMIDLATPDAFHIDPGLVWQFYSWRRYQALQARPNKAHYAIAALLKSQKIDFATITQNVDGLHSRLGHRPERLHEIHGNLFEVKCTNFMCTYHERNYRHPLTDGLRGTEDEYDTNVNARGIRAKMGLMADNTGGSGTSSIASPQFRAVKELEEKHLPRCPVCSGLLRPGVVWFGELLPLRELNDIDDWMEEGPIDLILVVGTSGTVYPANSYVERVLLQGGKAAVFNTDIEEEVVQGKVADTWGFRGDCEELLPYALKPLIGNDETEQRISGDEVREESYKKQKTVK